MDPKQHIHYKMLAGAGCLCMLGIILTVGLWPFHIPANRVHWLGNRDGLEFGGHGSAVSLGAIQARGLTNAAATLEIWLEPAHTEATGTILAFDDSAHPGEPFSLHQVRDALVIRRNNVDPQGISRTVFFIVDGVLQQKTPVLVTVCLDSQGTSAFVNGAFAKATPLSRTWNDLTGRIVLANSPTSNDSWPGTILGLAIYQRELTASEIAADYVSWTAKQKGIVSAEKGADALYLFDERGGAVVHNRLDPAADLTIPAHYFILHPPFLRSPWKGYRPNWRYWQDVAVNIAGFVPFGLCVCVYLSLTRVRHPGIITVILGLLASLGIELLQTFLPTRFSDTTDVITNTLGTAIGVIVCRAVIKSRRPLPDQIQGERREPGIVEPTVTSV
jgi:VanZ like family/Concanavalin A-like lectin/glucanases superfamily